jgi:hypothetical protein
VVATDLLRVRPVASGQPREQKVQVSRLAFDATGSRLWLLASDGDVYQASTPVDSVPALGPFGGLVMVAFLVLSAFHLGRRGLLRVT